MYGQLRFRARRNGLVEGKSDSLICVIKVDLGGRRDFRSSSRNDHRVNVDFIGV